MSAENESQTCNVRRWQRFLQRQGHYSGPIDGRFTGETATATRTFQQGHGLTPDGVVGPLTIGAAAGIPDGFQPSFDLGPDQTSDLRLCRPYFLVPLMVKEDAAEVDPINERQEEAEDVCARIREWLPLALKARNAARVTDIFVLSHGWHRNLFSAVSAYDRISSRLSLLLRTRRLDPVTPSAMKPSGDEAFFPLFLNLHWHSDPGQDGWVDKSGRRHKGSFLQNVQDVFERSPNAPPPDPASQTPTPSFTEDFEYIFEFFSQISASGTDALTNVQMNQEAPGLVERLQQYALQDDGSAGFDEKVVSVWKCYHESLPKRVLLDQDEPPHPYLGFWESQANLKNFLVSVLGAATAASLLFKIPWSKALAWKGMQHLENALPVWAWLLFYFGLALLGLMLARHWQQEIPRDKTQDKTRTEPQKKAQDKPAKGLPVLAVVSWAYLQVWFALPVLAHVLLTYPFGKLLPLLNRVLGSWGLFDERIGPRNGTAGKIIPLRIRDIRPALANFAQIPLRLFGDAIAKDSQWQAVVDTLGAQLAFYTMQRRGVYTGKLAFDFLQALYAEAPALTSARLHFLGHSFGGLVVANAARHLAFAMQPPAPPFPAIIHSVCLLEGALASNWFQGETILGERVNILASIYSRYDTANGYIYPIANHGKVSLGYNGMYGVGFESATNSPLPEQQGGFASLVRSPNLKPNPYPGRRRVMNVDASRLIYEGSAALGGGHDDIFKDDVIYLLWAISMLQLEAANELQYQGGPHSPLALNEKA